MRLTPDEALRLIDLMTRHRIDIEWLAPHDNRGRVNAYIATRRHEHHYGNSVLEAVYRCALAAGIDPAEAPTPRAHGRLTCGCPACHPDKGDH